jgi:hypothetical protein
MKSSHLTLLAGFSLLFPALFWCVKQTGFDNICYPYPVLVFVPMLFGLQWASFAVPPLLFFVWNPGLFRGDAKVPKRSYWLLGTAMILNLIWFAVCWEWGLHYQGVRYTYTICAANILWAVFLGGLLVGLRNRDASFKTNLLLHWALFAWLAWYAFPFFGEFL